MEKAILSRKEAAQVLGIGMVTLDALIRRRDDPIPSVRVGRRVLIPRLEFDAWLRRQVVQEAS